MGRYAERGIAGIEKDAARGRPPRKIDDDAIAAIVKKTTQETPKSATHWSTRTMAGAAGVSHSSIGRIWRKQGLKPHLSRTFKVSNDPKFAEKRFFRDLTDEQIRRGVFQSVDDLIVAIDDYVAGHNDKPKPFIWTKSARDILAKVMRAREAATGGPTA